MSVRKKRPITDEDRKHAPNPQQRKFVEEYLKTNNATLAYKAAYNYEGNLAKKRGSEVLKTAAVRVLLHDLDTKVAVRAEKILEKYAASKETILEELAKIAFTRTTDLLEYGEDGVVIKPSKDIGEAAAAVAEVSEYESKDGSKRVRVKTYDRRAALVDLGKALGMFTEKVDHSHEHKHVTFVINKD